MKIAKETWILLAIGTADLATTIVFIQNHGAQEANPLFKYYWEMGLLTFVGAKIAMMVGPLCVLEWARQHNPRFVSWALRGGIVAYVALYSVGFLHLNQDHMQDATSINYSDTAAAEANIAFMLQMRPTMPSMHRPHTPVHPVAASEAVTAF
jgi:hypothetical protein